MTGNPAPRPALRKAPDAGRNPAVPDELPAGGRASAPRKDRGKKAKRDDGSAELTVVLPKDLRKRLKAKAAEHGYTPEEATLQLLTIWVDG